MKIIQVDLVGLGKRHLTTWVEKIPELKEGVVISLKEYPDMVWKVVKMYSFTIDASTLDYNRNWDNNNYDKHEGLKL